MMGILRVHLKILFLLILAHIGHTNILRHDTMSTLVEKLSECILEIADKYFTQIRPTEVFFPAKKLSPEIYFSPLVQILHQRLNQPVIISDNRKRPLHKLKPGSYILITSGEGELKHDTTYKILQAMVDLGLNLSANLIITTTDVQKSRNEEYYFAGISMDMIWQELQIADMIAVAPGTSTRGQIDRFGVYNWTPEKQEDVCFKALTHVELIDSWIPERKAFLNNVTLYPKKKITDMRGCVLHAAYTPYAPLVFRKKQYIYFGTMIELFGVVERFLNFRLTVSSRAKTSEISDFYIPIGYGDFELLVEDCLPLYPYYSDDIRWYVPSGAPVPRWKSLIKIFNPFLWTCVATTFIVGSLTSWLLLKYTNHEERAVALIFVIIDTMLTYLAVGITDKYKGSVATTFFVIWLFYCLIINTAYQSALISFLANPGEETPIKTVQELEDSGLNMLSMIDFSIGHLQELTKYEMCKKFQICIKNAVNHRDTALLLNFFGGRLAIHHSFNSETKKPGIVAIDEGSHTLYFSSSINIHGCLLFNRVSEIIGRLFNAGLITRDLEFFYGRDKIFFTKFLNQDPFVMTLSHLQGAFYLLTIGMTFPLFAFLCEIIFHSIYKYANLRE
ncbi:Ionotropic receptor 451 [Blattella germanica]|nr:Ionotropic receptor 451 [Blattella germanica]